MSQLFLQYSTEFLKDQKPIKLLISIIYILCKAL